MIIVAAGGGSGGHVTPVSAVLRELKRHDPNLKAYFVTDRKFGGQAVAILSKLPFAVSVKRIYAGKLRRYHTVSVWRHIIDIRLMLQNIGDLFLVGFGFLQSLLFLWRIKPDVVFTKGGFVCVPVGLAARVLGVPLVLHDSDTHPGLANRILSRFAAAIATGAPTEYYPYPKEKMHYIGIPVDKAYRPLTEKEQQKCKAALDLPDTKKPLLVVTGGGLGARNLNHALISIAPQLLNSMAVLHVTGQATYNASFEQAPQHANYIIKPFLPSMAVAFGAADVVITRAGATAMSELAAAAKAVIVVPNPLLTAGHQLKNAEVYKKASAAIVLNEEELILNPFKLKQVVMQLMADAPKRRALGKALHAFAKPDAAIDMASLLVQIAATHKRKSEGRQ